MTLSELIHWNRPSNIPVKRKDGIGRSLLSLQDDMDHLLHDFLGRDDLLSWGNNTNFPTVDIIENGNSLKVKSELAGMTPDDIDVSVENGRLIIKGERSEEKEESDDNYIRQESSFGIFHRSIALPDTANYDKADASFKNGILTVTIPKKAEAVHKPKKLDIKKVA